MFKCGDKILYPMHGAGIVETIEEKKFLGEKQKYYVVNLPKKSMKVMIPVEKEESLNLREIVSSDSIPDIMQVFTEDYIDQGLNWNTRYKNNLKRVKSGDIYELAAVIKDLVKRDQLKGLSSGERKMLNDSKGLFVSEISLSTGKNADEIEEWINNYI